MLFIVTVAARRHRRAYFPLSLSELCQSESLLCIHKAHQLATITKHTKTKALKKNCGWHSTTIRIHKRCRSSSNKQIKTLWKKKILNSLKNKRVWLTFKKNMRQIPHFSKCYSPQYRDNNRIPESVYKTAYISNVYTQYAFRKSVYLYQFFSNFPAKYSRIFLLKFFDFRHHFRCGHFWFGAANHSWTNWACLLIAIQDFWHATVWYTKLSRYNAGTDASTGHFDNFQAHMIWQWSSIYENASKLINATLTCEMRNIYIFLNYFFYRTKFLLSKEYEYNWISCIIYHWS